MTDVKPKTSHPTRLTGEELERYARHIVLPEIGGAGQQKLKAASVLVVGAGGLGAPVLAYLAAAGIGHIRLVDDDHVSLSNLQRQIIHDSAQLGEAKVDSAKQALTRINPHVNVEIINARASQNNIAKLLDSMDVTVDGSDNFSTRFLIADACEEACIPLVSGAVNRFDGSLTTLAPYENDNPGYRDLFPQQPDDSLLPTCSDVGIVGAITGIIGSLQALEVIKLITGAGEPLLGRLVMMDGLSLSFSTLRYKKRKAV